MWSGGLKVAGSLAGLFFVYSAVMYWLFVTPGAAGTFKALALDATEQVEKALPFAVRKLEWPARTNAALGQLAHHLQTVWLLLDGIVLLYGALWCRSNYRAMCRYMMSRPGGPDWTSVSYAERVLRFFWTLLFIGGASYILHFVGDLDTRMGRVFLSAHWFSLLVGLPSVVFITCILNVYLMNLFGGLLPPIKQDMPEAGSAQS